MHSLVAFASQWGSKYGGINAFNTDFLSAFGAAYHASVSIVCCVSTANDKEITQAHNTHVTLIPLPYPPQDKIFTKEQAIATIDELNKHGIEINPDKTVWLGHDRISGEAAIHAAKQAGGRSAVIHHMSYDAYEAFAEDSASAYSKSQFQKALFKQADLVLAVGPFLRDALSDLLLDSPKPIQTIIPGLAEITPVPAPNVFSAFLSGRLSDDAKKIKQGHLGIAGFAKAISEAHKFQYPESLVKRPKLVLRGVDFESRQNYGNTETPINPEEELNKFAEEYADGRINLHALPYTQNRDELYDNLKSASVALMPSWHEGFGLVAWEAIAAGVPLILSQDSGVYEFLNEICQGSETGYVELITVKGSTQPPFFLDNDLNQVVEAITKVARNPEAARNRAMQLREKLSRFTWPACVEEVVKYFNWDISKGSPKITDNHGSTQPTEQDEQAKPTETSDTFAQSPLHMPVKYWQPGRGIPESQLLRADEALVPFDLARQSRLDELDKWLDNTEFPVAVRLETGAGGVGKTRLALELCQQRLKANWLCGFLTKENSVQELPKLWQALFDLGRPMLMVMDYAETRQPVLLALIKLILKKPSQQAVRLLLLARNGGEWWDNLPGRDAECERLLGGYATTGPFELPGLYLDEISRAEAYQRAITAYAHAIGFEEPNIAPDLSGEHFGKPLYVQMSALLALFGERPATAEGLIKALLNHERRYWTDALAEIAIHQPENYAQQLLALATLAGGFATPKQALTYWTKASVQYPLPATQFASLFKALVPLYPGDQGLQAVQPDLLGEALVAQALSQPQTDELLNAVLGNQSDKSIQHHALTVIARLTLNRSDLWPKIVAALKYNFCSCCQILVQVAIETPSQLSRLAQEAFTQLTPAGKIQAAGLLLPLMENESIELAFLSYEIDSFQMERSEKKLAKKPHDTSLIAKHAVNLTSLAVRAYRIGDNSMAVETAKLSLGYFDQLSKNDLIRFESNYAKSLSNYAAFLGHDGKDDEEAIGYAKKALDIFKTLAVKDKERFEPHYAKCLNNYANCLRDIGNVEGIDYAKQALDIRQSLAAKNQDRFEPDYAMSLDSYANCLRDNGNDEAIDYAKQALDIRQQLAAKNQDRFEPDYAVSLSYYANHLSDVGKDEKAINYAKKALDIRQLLAAKNPERFGKEYYMNHYYLQFLHWLCELEYFSKDSIDGLTKIIADFAEYKKIPAEFYSNFVQACMEQEYSSQLEQFKLALLLSRGLSKADRHYRQDDLLCLYFWMNRYEPSALAGIDWQEDWYKFIQRRKNRLPYWMQKLSQRLKFDFVIA